MANPAEPQDFVARDEDRVLVKGRFNAHAAHWVLARVLEARRSGYNDVVLDLTLCEVAYPDGLVPVAAFATAERGRSAGFRLLLPVNEQTARHIINCNLAHFIEPDRFPYHHETLTRHVPIRQYTSPKEQVAVVREFVQGALGTIMLPRDVLQGLEWSLNEVMDNVLIHADSPGGGFVQATTLADRVAFTVADCGRGVLASLREAIPGLSRDTEAIGEAVKAGVTRNPEIGQGNGLAGALRISTLTGGSFSMTSGCGILRVFAVHGAVESHGRQLPDYQAFPGTVVSLQILRNPSFSMAEALGFTQMVGGVYDVIEANYETDDGTAFMIKLSQEALGFGSREAGQHLRTKLRNLLAAEPGKPLVVDWEGVPIISSSFADEAIGKLFVELGPTEFAGRVRNLHMESLVRGLVDKAILQRTVQAMDSAAKSTPKPPTPQIEDAPLPDHDPYAH